VSSGEPAMQWNYVRRYQREQKTVPSGFYRLRFTATYPSSITRGLGLLARVLQIVAHRVG
jgi:hypothetical protein